MQSLSDDERKKVFGEILSDELKAIHELVKDVPVIKNDVRSLRQDVEELKSNMKIVKAAITDVSKQQSKHDQRITHLEPA